MIRKSFFLFSLVLSLLAASVQSCQKTSSSLPAQDADSPAKVSINLGDDLGADDRTCGSCKGFLQIDVEDKGSYAVTLSSQGCAGGNFIDPISFIAGSSVFRSVPIAHDRIYRLQITNTGSATRTYTATLHNPPYPSLPLAGGSLTIPANTSTSALFVGKTNCGCEWVHDCSNDIN